MTTTTRAAGLLAGLVLALAASGCDDLTASDFLTRLRGQGCAYRARCGDFPDAATCLASTQDGTGPLRAELAARAVTYDGAVGRKCLAAMPGRACDMGGRPDDVALCPGTFKGAVADGGACFSNEECASGRCNTTACTTACCAGVCATALALDAECGDFNTTCAPGTYCRTTLPSYVRVCATPVPLGGECSSGFDVCADGSTCHFNVCSLPAAEGEDCTTLRCASSADRCTTGTPTCTPRLAPGQPCQADSECLAYAFCDPTGQCVAKPGPGQPCAERGCLGDLACTSAGCALLPAPGAGCR